MSGIPVRFTYMTGVKPRLFTAATLKGTWDTHGRRTADWSARQMTEIWGWDGCPAIHGGDAARSRARRRIRMGGRGYSAIGRAALGHHARGTQARLEPARTGPEAAITC